MTLRLVAATALAAAAFVVAAAPDAAVAQSKKEPPACALISFRALPEGVGEGEQEAGLYKSRFGRINVTGTVKNGRAEDYFVTVNGKKLTPATSLPSSVSSCAQQKRMPAPAAAQSACTGSRLRVLVDRAGDKRYLVLYALQGKKWATCSAGTA
jgi:hypothetical protein